MRKLLCLVLALTMLVPMALNAFAADDGIAWPFKTDTGMPFRPFDNYLSMNNPPSFSWPSVVGSTYELKICTDPEMKNVAYERSGLNFNVYNFNEPFETDKKYYWSVRYTLNGQKSVWSEVMEFMISGDAYDNTFPEITPEYLDSVVIQNHQHPRLSTPEQIEQLKKIDKNDVGYSVIDKIATACRVTYKDAYPPQLTFKEIYDRDKSLGGNGAKYTTISQDLSCVAARYIIDGDKEDLDFVIGYLRHMMTDTSVEGYVGWDPAAAYPWDQYEDCTGPIFINSLALIYDWLYNDLPEDIQTGLPVIIERYFVRWWENIAELTVEFNEKTGRYEVPTAYNPQNDQFYIYPSKINNLYTFIDRSHQWRVKQFCLGALAIYEDSQFARSLLAHIIPLYVNSLPFSYEDGTYNNGPYYYNGHGPLDPDLSDVLAYATNGKIDVRGTAGYQNRAYYLTYQWPVGGFMTFYGDQSRQTSKQANYYNVFLQHNIMNENLSDEKRGINAWMLYKNGYTTNNYVHTDAMLSALRHTEEVETVVPTMLPKAKFFKDDGITAMFSDVADDNKNALVFRSSPKGSEGHMHPDQNSFIIQALGENLLIDSDYYDSMKSAFDIAWNRNTFAHNTVTYDVGEGQPHSQKSAKGKTTEFLNHSDFDLVTGDATMAYNKGIGKFVRDIIYIRPDTYIIVDDLKAAEGVTSEFEWWIHTMGNMKLYDSKKGVHITKNEASVDIKVAYPENVEPYYLNDFKNPEGAVAPFSSTKKEYLGDVHMYFKTEKTEGTKIVSYMNVHKERDGQPYVKEEQIGNVLKLSFEDGTISYIKLDDSETVTVDGYTFMGRALTVKGKRYMVVDETLFKKGDKLLFSADVPTSAAFGNKEISLSSIENEANVKIYMPGAETFNLIRDEELLPIESGEASNGIKPTVNGDYVDAYMYYGTYTLYVNDKPVPGSEVSINLSQTIDGNSSSVEVKGTINGNQIYAEYLPEGVEDGKYFTMGKSNGISGKVTDPGSLITLSKDSPLIINKKNAFIELKEIIPDDTANSYKSSKPEFDYYDSIADVIIPATEYDKLIGMGSSVKKAWTYVADDENGVQFKETVLQGVDEIGESLKYKLEVPESGYYDVVISLAAGAGGYARRLLLLGGKAFPVTFKTDAFNDIDSYRLGTNVYLEKGVNDLDIYVTGNQVVSTYKVGLIKHDK